VESARWEHFEHRADVGLVGLGPTLAAAFEQAALALTAVVTDPTAVRPCETISIECEASDTETLLVAWLDAIVYEMATRRMVFGRFEVEMGDKRLRAEAAGEKVEPARHAPAVEVKGATYTGLEVRRGPEGLWRARCVVDV
jgi:tRNA nucleotidyltransferase (CCA-adding enzyme)